jgi:hypothetical protein
MYACATPLFRDTPRTDVGCCKEDYSLKHQDVFRLPEDLKVGKCWWTYLYVGYDKVDAGMQPTTIPDITVVRNKLPWRRHAQQQE